MEVPMSQPVVRGAVSARIAAILCVVLSLAPGVSAQTTQVTAPPEASEPAAEPSADPASNDASALEAEEPSDSDLILAAALHPWQGDLDGIVERGYIRIVIPNDPMFLAYDGDKLIGLSAEIGQELESYFKQTLKAQVRPVFMPMGRDRMIPALTEGLADVITANLTITPERAAVVAFTDPLLTNVREIVVTGFAAGPVASLDDLVKVGVAVRRTSSYHTHLRAVNQARAAAGQPAIPIETVDETLEDYDLIDMVQSGLLAAIVVDDHKARFWSQMFEDVTLHEDLAISEGGEIAWAVRQNAPKLLAALNKFVPKVRKGSMLGNILIKRYLGSTKWLEKVDSAVATERFETLAELFRTNAERYDLDWMLLAAQGYQESQLDQSTRSRVGAIGIMQVMPSTARDPVVGIPDISKTESNIHAGTKYLRFLRSQYFDDPAITPINQIFFALAAYNAGPGNISKARKKATKMGLDPNVWFDNVEVAAGKSISREPVAYVRNILKYGVFFRLALGSEPPGAKFRATDSPAAHERQPTEAKAAE
jgi:membrane-bound lytic murein transglycosylase MltF